jgi:hypothetical protein
MKALADTVGRVSEGGRGRRCTVPASMERVERLPEYQRRSDVPDQAERLRRRAAFLRDLDEARALRERIAPRRARVGRIREALRRATYRTG